MSHVASVALHVKDLNALARAGAQCGLQFNENKPDFNWFGKWVEDYHESDAAYKNGVRPEDYGKCLHTLSVPGDPDAYEIGVIARPDGKPGYELIFDFWGHQGAKLMAHIGTPEMSKKTGLQVRGPIKNANKLKQAYAEQVAQAAVRAKGFQVLRTETPEGKVLIRAIRG